MIVILLVTTFPSVFIEALDSQHMLATLKSLSFQSVRTYTYGEFYPAFDLPAHYQFIARLVNRSLEDFFHILSVKSNASNIFLRFKRVNNTCFYQSQKDWIYFRISNTNFTKSEVVVYRHFVYTETVSVVVFSDKDVHNSVGLIWFLNVDSNHNCCYTI